MLVCLMSIVFQNLRMLIFGHELLILMFEVVNFMIVEFGNSFCDVKFEILVFRSLIVGR